MVERAFVVVEAEQQRADDAFAVLVPPESGHHAVGGPRVLDLEHRPLAGLVGGIVRLRDHPVETRALETLQPVDRRDRDRVSSG